MSPERLAELIKWWGGDTQRALRELQERRERDKTLREYVEAWPCECKTHVGTAVVRDVEVETEAESECLRCGVLSAVEEG